MLVGITCGLAVPLTGKYLVDSVIPSGDYRVLTLFALGLLGLHIVDSIVALAPHVRHGSGLRAHPDGAPKAVVHSPAAATA